MADDGKNLAWRFVGLFVDEARQHLEAAAERAAAWRAGPDSAADEAFRRHAHSLRGMAATMGLGEMAAVARCLEDRGLGGCDASDVDAALDGMAAVVESIARGDQPDHAGVSALANRFAAFA